MPGTCARRELRGAAGGRCTKPRYRRRDGGRRRKPKRAQRTRARRRRHDLDDRGQRRRRGLRDARARRGRARRQHPEPRRPGGRGVDGQQPAQRPPHPRRPAARSAARRATTPAAGSASSSPTAPTRWRRRRCSATSSTTPRRRSSSPVRSGRPRRPEPTGPRTPWTRSASPPARPPPQWACWSCFGGEIHHARCVRKTDTTSLVAFSSPQTGPLGRVSEGHPTIWSRIPRNPPLDPPHLDNRVVIIPTASGDDGALARAALATEPDGVVIGTLGAGHLNPDLLEIWAGRRRADAGRRLLPLRARGDPQLHLRLSRLRAGPARRPGSSRPASSHRRPRG